LLDFRGDRAKGVAMLTWYFDLVSPFAWLALPDVEALEGPVAYRPVLFGVLLKHWGQLGPAEIPPKRVHTYRQCVWLAGQRGIPFRFPPVHPFNSLAAMRLLTAIGPEPRTVRTAMEAIWSEGLDVSSPVGFAALGKRLAVADPQVVVERSDARGRLRDATYEALAKGVFGVPTLEVGGELFWGADAMPLAKAFMADPALFDRGEMARIRSLGEMHRNRLART
jgi:2-hydroxychromene-2-carboxylate isomerase